VRPHLSPLPQGEESGAAGEWRRSKRLWARLELGYALTFILSPRGLCLKKAHLGQSPPKERRLRKRVWARLGFWVRPVTVSPRSCVHSRLSLRAASTGCEIRPAKQSGSAATMTMSSVASFSGAPAHRRAGHRQRGGRAGGFQTRPYAPARGHRKRNQPRTAFRWLGLLDRAVGRLHRWGAGRDRIGGRRPRLVGDYDEGRLREAAVAVGLHVAVEAAVRAGRHGRGPQ